MSEAYLEHTNLTVRDPDATANMLVELFGWHVRWQGGAIHDGYTVHVGSEQSYLALYSHSSQQTDTTQAFYRINGLNHLGIVVDDIQATEAKILKAGFTTRSHADYEPGRRFYFEDEDGLEYEVISYR